MAGGWGIWRLHHILTDPRRFERFCNALGSYPAAQIPCRRRGSMRRFVHPVGICRNMMAENFRAQDEGRASPPVAGRALLRFAPPSRRCACLVPAER